MPRYDELKNDCFALATIPDGYNGATARVGLALHDGRIWTVADCGAFPSHLAAHDIDHARQVIANDPAGHFQNVQPIGRGWSYV
jgi:hypothetical protein